MEDLPLTIVLALTMAKNSTDQWKSKNSLTRWEEFIATGKYCIDEAGYGSLCGPVVSAACAAPDLVIDGMIDSKKPINERGHEVIC